MAAAQQLFLDKGVDATTISDIVAAAGVAKGTFYHYFQAKTDILLALRERFTQAFQQRIANAVEACPANDHPGRLRAWTESGLAGYLEGYRLHDVVYSEHHHHQRGNQERDRVLEQLAELLENGAAAGAWAPGLDLSFWVARRRARGRAGVSGPGAVGPGERRADGMEGGRRGRRWT